MMEDVRLDQVYRPAEVAKALRVSTVTISRAILSGKLKAFRVGGQWRIIGSELASYVDGETRRALSRTGLPGS